MPGAMMASAAALQCQIVAGASSSLEITESIFLRGTPLPAASAPSLGSRRRLSGLQIMAMATKKKLASNDHGRLLRSLKSRVSSCAYGKVNVYDDGWSKQWFGAGIFAEDTESESVDIVKKLEKKKLLSQVEKAGLLSKAESVGLSLSTIERLGLLSKAEQFGLLSLAEKFATTSPATLASLSLPLLVGALASVVLIPDDTSFLVAIQYTLATLFLVGAGGLFVGSVVLSSLQEE